MALHAMKQIIKLVENASCLYSFILRVVSMTVLKVKKFVVVVRLSVVVICVFNTHSR